MLWVLKRTVSINGSSEHPKHMLKLIYKKKITNLLSTGFPQALEIMENLENHSEKFHAWKNDGILKKN